MRPAVLLTNAEERSVLAACRSLAAAGYRVAGASHTALAPAQWSRACSERVRVPDPRHDARGFVDGLRAELTRHRYAVLMPGSDGALLAISRERERLPEATQTGLPAHPIVERALSRAHLGDAARAAGFAEIPSVICAGPHEALSAARELGYPLALKSAYAAHADDVTVTGAAKGRLVRDEAELRNQAPDFDGALLLQPFVAGDPVSLAGTIAADRLLAVAVSRYIRMWPPGGGSVAFGETIASPPGLEERARRLLGELGWQGIFELELIRTPDGELVPIDLNPRPYGSMALANAAGAPLAAVWCEWLLRRGESAARGERPLRARAGVRYRWEDGDLRYFIRQLRRGNVSAALAAARAQTGVVHAHLQRRDPLPLLARAAYLAKRTVST